MHTLLTHTFCLMCHVQRLLLIDNYIGNAGLTALAKAVESGALAALETLNLGGNAIGDDGMSALAKAIKPTAENASGALPKCTTIITAGNPASAEAEQAVMDAIASRA